MFVAEYKLDENMIARVYRHGKGYDISILEKRYCKCCHRVDYKFIAGTKSFSSLNEEDEVIKGLSSQEKNMVKEVFKSLRQEFGSLNFDEGELL